MWENASHISHRWQHSTAHALCIWITKPTDTHTHTTHTHARAHATRTHAHRARAHTPHTHHTRTRARTHSEYVILIISPRQWLRESASMLHNQCIAYLVCSDSYGKHIYHTRQIAEFRNFTERGIHSYHCVLNGETPRVFWTGNGDTVNEFIRTNHET
jgi:hypothetical protein